VYKILFTTQAARTIQKAPRNIADLIRQKLEQIADDPYAPHSNATKLQGRPGFRIRIGDWRVIYEINKEEMVIIILKIAPRSEVYR